MEIISQRLNLIGLVAAFGLSIAAFWLGVSNARSKTLGLVDMQLLLSAQSQQLAKSYPNGQVPPGVMQQVVEDIKTVIQEMMFKAARLIRHAGRWVLGLGANDRGFAVFDRHYGQMSSA